MHNFRLALEALGFLGSHQLVRPIESPCRETLGNYRRCSISEERPTPGDQLRGSETFAQVAPPSLERRTTVVEPLQIMRP